MYWRIDLQIRRKYLSVLSEVELEGIALPPPHGLDDLKRYAAQQEFQCAANAKAVTGENRKAVLTGNSE